MKFKSEVQLEALNNATVDTDKFLVSDSSTVKYRTGAQLLSDLGIAGIYVPYTGATGNVDLGTHTLSSYNLIVNHTSGSGVAASITKGGNGEALTINKTSGSGNAMSVTGGLTSLVDLSLSSIANATTDTDRFIVSDGGTIKYRTGAEVLSDIGAAPASGSGNYIQNQNASAQSANMWISGSAYIDSNVGIGTTSAFSKVEIAGAATTWAGSPSITFTDNAGTVNSRKWLIGNVATDYGSLNFAVSTTNSDNPTNPKMTITKEGNVGIGTTSPAQKLDIDGLSYFRNDIYMQTNKGIFFSGNSAYGAGVYGANSGNDLVINANGSEKMRVTSVGSVGIGTSSPGEKLTVSGGSVGISIDGTTAARTYYNRNGSYIWSTGLRAGDTKFHIFDERSADRLVIDDSGAVRFNAYGSGTFTGTATQKLAVDSSGNIIEIPIGAGPVDGSGTTNYVTKWTDADTIGNSSIFDNGAGGVLIGKTTSTFGDSTRTSLEVSGSTDSIISLFTGSTLNGYWFHNGTNMEFLNSKSGATIFYTNSAERMRIQGNGNVGIGTSSPTQKLDVVGAGKFSSSVQVGDDSTTASAANVGATRYRSDSNNSYMDMVMQTGASTYAWVNVVQNNW